MEKSIFERKIQPILQYIGTIGAILMSFIYVVIVLIIIVGFEVQKLESCLIFALVNAVVGIIIMQFLKIQGISFAENLQENKEILKLYYSNSTKDRKLHSIQYYWAISVVKDILVKGVSVVISTTGLIYIVVQGCHDYMLLLMALANLIMCVCFGLLALNSAYNYYNNTHIPFILEKLKLNNKITKGDIEECLKLMEKNIETLKNKY